MGSRWILDRQSRPRKHPQPTVRTADGGSPPAGASPATILLLATWVGLVAGWLDLGLMVVNRRLIHGDFYRLGEHFVWLIPLGVAVVVLVPGMVLALIARLRRSGVRPGIAVGLLAFVGFLDVCARLPLELWASLLLSGGAGDPVRPDGRRPPAGGPRAGAPDNAVARRRPGWRSCWRRSAGGPGRTIGRWPPCRRPPPAARNVLLIVWDTVRAENLSLYGYGRRTTPNLERLAGRGVRFDLAFATSSWTLPSHASLFTGRWPHELGVGWTSPLRPDVPTLAEYLGARGYDTAGFVANLEYCGRETGLDRGFAHYDDYPIEPYETFTRYVGLGHRMELPSWACVLERLVEKATGRSWELSPRSSEHVKRGAEVDREFLDWLSWQQGRRRPFFAFLNYNDAHSPYEVAGPLDAGIRTPADDLPRPPDA